MSFTAKYRGDCRDCDEGIRPGETVEFDDDRNVLHVVCPDRAGLEGKPRPVCPRCFMELPYSNECGTCFE